MKKVAGVIILLLFLSGCGASNDLDRGMKLRSDLLKAESCSFEADITADYGDKVYTFSASCEADAVGDLRFEVTAPETIAGITGSVSDEGGKLTFDDTALHFDLMADDQLSPVSAPWIFLKTLRSGYLTSAGMEGELLRLTIDDSYDDDALRVDIWLDGENMPKAAEILHDGRTILSLSVRTFVIG